MLILPKLCSLFCYINFFMLVLLRVYCLFTILICFLLLKLMEQLVVFCVN